MASEIKKSNSEIRKLITSLPCDHEFQAVSSGNSMYPLIIEKDMLTIKHVTAEKSAIGDIAAIFDRQNNIIVHRIIKKIKTGNQITLQMKGDNNCGPDIQLTPGANFAGIVVAVIKQNPTKAIFAYKPLFVFLQRVFLRHSIIRNLIYKFLF